MKQAGHCFCGPLELANVVHQELILNASVKGQILSSVKGISQTLVSSEVRQTQRSWGLVIRTHLLVLKPVIDDSKVQSERQRAKDWAETANEAKKSLVSSKFRREKAVERSRVGAEAASHFVCFYSCPPPRC